MFWTDIAISTIGAYKEEAQYREYCKRNGIKPMRIPRYKDPEKDGSSNSFFLAAIAFMFGLSL